MELLFEVFSIVLAAIGFACLVIVFLSIVIALPSVTLYYWWLSLAIGGLAIFFVGILLEACFGFSLTIWQSMIIFVLVVLTSLAVQWHRHNHKRQKDSETADKEQTPLN